MQQQCCISTISSLIAKARCAAAAERELVGLHTKRHAQAAKVEQHQRIVVLAVHELAEIHACMNREACAITGDDYEVCHTVSFELHCSMDEQRKSLSKVLISGLVNVASMVQDMAEGAQEVADED
jgi:hypothetical protein